MLAPLGESHGPGPFLSLLLRARLLFPEQVQRLEEETKLDLGYRTDGLLLLAFDDRSEQALERRQEWQSKAGLDIERLPVAEALQLEPAIDASLRAALIFRDDHQIENRALVEALRISAARASADFRLGSGVRRILPATSGAVVELCNGERMEAGRVVLAAGSWSGQIEGLPRSLPVEPIRGQILSVENVNPPIRHILATPLGYLVPRSDGRVIVGATAERVGYGEGTTLAGLRQLTAVAEEIAPGLLGQRLVAHWSGLRPATPDGLPILGPDPEAPSVIYATGHFRNGILLALITGDIIGDVVAGIEPEVDLWPYRPDRFDSPAEA